MARIAEPAERYFHAMTAALAGLDAFLRDDHSPLYRHDLVAQVIAHYIDRLGHSFSCWRNRLGFSDRFRISRADSGFPVFQHVLELEKDSRTAADRLARIPDAAALREEMVDFILRRKAFPAALQKMMAERLYLEEMSSGDTFLPIVPARTIRVTVNPKTRRPVCLVHWGAFDGAANLPLVYMALIEDSSPKLVETLVTSGGKLNRHVTIPIPVEGLLNPELAHRFDDFVERNSAYSLSPVTVAANLDEAFDALHPTQLRRVVLGPFYGAGITEHNSLVQDVLARIRRIEHAWLLTWTIQEVHSKGERPGRRGLWSSEPARQTFHLETDDLEAARQGVSAYENHALLPHEAYQALYASGEAQDVFAGYKVHVLSDGKVISHV